MNLFPIPEAARGVLFCGPTAICAATGVDPGSVLRAAHRYMGRPHSRQIVGMSDVQFTGTLALLGFRCEIHLWKNKRQGGLTTFWRYIQAMPKYDRPVVVRFAEHYGTITYDEYVCPITGSLPVPIATAPYLRHRVHCIIKVDPL